MARLREGAKGVYEVEKIVAQRWSGGRLEYRIKWRGFDNPADNTWELASTCDCRAAIEEFKKEQRKKEQGACSGRRASSRATTTTCSSSAASVPTASSSFGKKVKADKALKRKAADGASDEDAPVPKAEALPAVDRSSPHIPVLRSADKPVNDDYQIEEILLSVQTAQNSAAVRFTERFTELQKYSYELQELKLKRQDARKQRKPLPPLTVDRHRAVCSALAGDHPTFATPSSSGRQSCSTDKPTVLVLPSKKAPVGPEKHSGVEPMTFEEKQQLALNIEKLPDELQEKVAGIIVSHEKGFKDSNGEGIEVDFDTLKPTTLRELDGYVKECIESKIEKLPTPKSAAQKESKKTEPEQSRTDRPTLQGMPPHGAAIKSVLQRLSEKKADSFSLSDSGSSSSDSSSSDSSDSESDKTSESDQFHTKLVPAASSSPVQSTSSATVVTTPMLQTNSPMEISGGSAVSILDLLLPSDDKKVQSASGVGASSQNPCSVLAKKVDTVVNVKASGAFEQSDKHPLGSEAKARQLKETDHAQKHHCELAVQSVDVSSDSPWPSIGSLLLQTTASRDAEIQRMMEQERERRRREAAQVDPVSQSEMMANFEDTF